MVYFMENGFFHGWFISWTLVSNGWFINVYNGTWFQMVGLSRKNPMVSMVGTPKYGWFLMEYPTKMDDLGLPLFQETSIWGNV